MNLKSQVKILGTSTSTWSTTNRVSPLTLRELVFATAENMESLEPNEITNTLRKRYKLKVSEDSVKRIIYTELEMLNAELLYSQYGFTKK